MAEKPTVCPHCGWNFESDSVIWRGPWKLEPDRAFLGGQRLPITPSCAAVLYAVAKANGTPISREAILNRISDSENNNVVAVYLSRLRKILGPRFPIKTEWGRGLVWVSQP